MKVYFETYLSPPKTPSLALSEKNKPYQFFLSILMPQNILISSKATNAREHFISMNISSNSARGDLISLAWQTAMTSFLPNIQIVLFDDLGNFIYYV